MTGLVRGRGGSLLGAIKRLSELRLRENRGLVPPHAGDERAGDQGHLKSGEIDSLLTDMVAREGRDKVVNRKTHDCGTEERGDGEGEEERMKYQARIDSSQGGIKGVRPTGHMVSSLPARDPASASVPSASTPHPVDLPLERYPHCTLTRPPCAAAKRTGRGGSPLQRDVPRSAQAFVCLPHHVLVLSAPH